MLFHFIMGKIEIQSQRKLTKLKQQSGDTGRNQNKRQDDQKNELEEEGSLITYREFINAIKSADKLYKSILPRTLTFKEVLLANKAEPVYTMSDMDSDNFAMFRYELNTIVRQHQYVDEGRCDRYMGRNPLSKADGK